MPDHTGPTPHRAGWRARIRAVVASGGRLRGGGSSWWRGAAPLVFVVAGALFVTSWVSAGGQDLRAGRYDDLPGLAAAEARQLEGLRAQQEKLAAEVDGLTDGLSDSIGAREAQREARAAQRPAGLDPARGAGVTITLDDAPDAVADSVTDNVNNLVVHQQDIQAVVNALWAGGATAMTIQDQRVVSTTGIRCVGNTVVLHDVPYAPPYVIRAVGPTSEMLSSVNQSPYIGFYLQAVAAYQLGWDVQVDPDLQLPGYSGSIELDYARPAGGTGDLPDDRT
ncbi:DUF881 domain-containing protein [Nocardioides iriomotensis]|uniref:DUF881 domain-containing protein n=1 Tax=Nocardioides iriomotensis TaxID=715784 RepID=A0A4Q5IZ33_9ACTN|nr:DUF881 domain-containing protein [Nocardioides iriomotensis]RYU10265.1 DUF881 domain-containing protein [Nocardioides iriomotensis]